jgi:hypothetical protein
MMRYRIPLLAVSFALLVIGCGEDHCMSGDQTRCDEDVVQRCDGYVWIDVEDCSESELGPYCDQIEGGDAYCTDGTY